MSTREFLKTKRYIEQLLERNTSLRRIQELTGLSVWQLRGYLKVINPEEKMEWPQDD